MNESTARKLLLAAAAYHVVLGLYFLLAPGSAYESVAEFPPRNDHVLRDVGTFYIAFGLAIGVAAGRRSWRVPVLLLVLVQYAIHTVNHVLDVGDAATDGKGIFAAVSLGLITAALAFVLGVSVRRDEITGRGERAKARAAADPEPAPEPPAAADPQPPADPEPRE